MMDKELMKKALMQKRGKGIDLTIILGNPEDEKSEDLAPGQPEEEVSQDQLLPEDVMAGMSDYDKSSLMDSEPRSLGERAKKELLMKMRK